MGNKYKKNQMKSIDLHERKNLKIISSEKQGVSDRDVELFKERMQLYSQNANEFCEYLVKKRLEDEQEISKNEFDIMMKEIKKQHKILKYLLEEQEN